MKFLLQQLSIEDGKEIYDFLQTIPKEENGYANPANGLTYPQFKEWLIQMDNYAKGIGLPDWMVPSTEYWFLVDGTIVGNIRLRHYLTPTLQRYGGHIGYAIAPANRGNGYAKAMLQEIIKKAKEFGIYEILLTPNTNNRISCHVIASCGGILEKQNEPTSYYKIKSA